MSTIEQAPTAILRREEDLPFVDIGDGSTLQVLQVDLANGVWTIRNRFRPGTVVQRHRHTGSVAAFTTAGAWHYLEAPDEVNVAGAYLFEPAGSVHTLHVLDDNEVATDVWFVVHGANLNLNEAGEVDYVIDAASVYEFYVAACAEQHGVVDPPVVVVDAAR
jgi:quercetin dioxygenase-like cupin family protein